MGRGRGAAENEDKGAIIDNPGGMYDDEELDDEEREELMAARAQEQMEKEKTADQKAEEAKVRWKYFHYNPPAPGGVFFQYYDEDDKEKGGKWVYTWPTQWVPVTFWIIFVICIINCVMTLEQWHGTHAWRRPFDLYPADSRPGGWPQNNHGCRFTGGIFAMTGSALAWVLKPTADRYKCMFAWLLIGVIMCSVSFGYDLQTLTQTARLSYCTGINDMKTHKYMCDFNRFRATVILDIIVACFSLVLAIMMLWQSHMGYVSRKLEFNEQKGEWQKKVANPDLPWETLYPRKFAQLRAPFNIVAIMNFILAGSLLGCSVTQSTGQFITPPGYSKPLFNDGYNWPRDLYVITSDEAFRYGSWPLANFNLRLAANTAAIVTTAFAIQWRNDGRLMQAIVMLLSLIAGACYLSAFSLDYQEYLDVVDGGCYPEANGNVCVYSRYIAVILFDFFCGAILIILNLRHFWVWFIQARNPIEMEHVNHGWWCFGEWQAKAAAKAQEKAIQEKRIADAAAKKAAEDAEAAQQVPQANIPNDEESK